MHSSKAFVLLFNVVVVDFYVVSCPVLHSRVIVHRTGLKLLWFERDADEGRLTRRSSLPEAASRDRNQGDGS